MVVVKKGYLILGPETPACEKGQRIERVTPVEAGQPYRRHPPSALETGTSIWLQLILNPRGRAKGGQSNLGRARQRT